MVRIKYITRFHVPRMSKIKKGSWEEYYRTNSETFLCVSLDSLLFTYKQTDGFIELCV